MPFYFFAFDWAEGACPYMQGQFFPFNSFVVKSGKHPVGEV